MSVLRVGQWGGVQQGIDCVSLSQSRVIKKEATSHRPLHCSPHRSRHVTRWSQAVLAYTLCFAPHGVRNVTATRQSQA